MVHRMASAALRGKAHAGCFAGKAFGNAERNSFFNCFCCFPRFSENCQSVQAKDQARTVLTRGLRKVKGEWWGDAPFFPTGPIFSPLPPVTPSHRPSPALSCHRLLSRRKRNFQGRLLRGEKPCFYYSSHVGKIFTTKRSCNYVTLDHVMLCSL